MMFVRVPFFSVTSSCLVEVSHQFLLGFSQRGLRFDSFVEVVFRVPQV